MNPYQSKELAPIIERTRERMAATALNAGHAAVGSVEPFAPEQVHSHIEAGLGHDQVGNHGMSEIEPKSQEARVATGYTPIGIKRVSIVGDRSERLRNEREIVVAGEDLTGDKILMAKSINSKDELGYAAEAEAKYSATQPNSAASSDEKGYSLHGDVLLGDADAFHREGLAPKETVVRPEVEEQSFVVKSLKSISRADIEKALKDLPPIAADSDHIDLTRMD